MAKVEIGNIYCDFAKYQKEIFEKSYVVVAKKI
jgi:hypothetical protein